MAEESGDWAQILQMVGTAVGAVFGGPAGAAVGSSVGKRLGSEFEGEGGGSSEEEISNILTTAFSAAAGSMGGGGTSGIGPVADGGQYAAMLGDSSPQAVSSVGPVSDGNIYAQMLEGQERPMITAEDALQLAESVLGGVSRGNQAATREAMAPVSPMPAMSSGVQQTPNNIGGRGVSLGELLTKKRIGV